jgi:thioredoxin reductase
MLDWLIVGGGIQGTYLSHYLVNKKGVAREKLRVLDPYEIPLARWDHLTRNTGMAYLRSPRVHHLDLSPSSIDDFVKTNMLNTYPSYLGDYRRPAYHLFQDHTRYTLEKYQLAELRLRGQATDIQVCEQGFQLETDQGNLTARRVVLALGRTHLHYPEWATCLGSQPGTVNHLFEYEFSCSHLPTWSHCVVVGGGITAVQTALQLAERQPGRVTLLMRHRVRVRDLDSSAGWMGPKELDKFKKKPIDRRRVLIQRARNRGSIPSDVYLQLQQALRQGRLQLCQSEVGTAKQLGQAVELTLINGERLITDRLILATGFDQHRPGGAWLDAIIQKLNLRCAACGYPIVDHHLQWLDGLHVMGPLAELQVGPVAPNIIGGRMAAERIGRSS